MDGRRSDEDHPVCGDSSWSQQLCNLLQVLRVFLQRDVLLRVFICKTEDCVSSFLKRALTHCKSLLARWMHQWPLWRHKGAWFLNWNICRHSEQISEKNLQMVEFSYCWDPIARTKTHQWWVGFQWLEPTGFLWVVPSSEQSLLPKKTVTAEMLLSAEVWQPMSRGNRILPHLEL